MKILEDFEVFCIEEPRGDQGLEGFDLSSVYKAQRMQDSKGFYYRLYPNSDDKNSTYYETCNTKTLYRYFKRKE